MYGGRSFETFTGTESDTAAIMTSFVLMHGGWCWSRRRPERPGGGGAESNVRSKYEDGHSGLPGTREVAKPPTIDLNRRTV